MKKSFWFLLIAIFSAWMLLPFIIYKFFDTVESKSSLSDTFQIINSLFSSLGFAALIYTIIIQQQEIKNQIRSVNNTNRLTYLTAMLNYYSAEEDKYFDINKKKSDDCKLKKENILKLINFELNLLENEKPGSV